MRMCQPQIARFRGMILSSSYKHGCSNQECFLPMTKSTVHFDVVRFEVGVHRKLLRVGVYSHPPRQVVNATVG